MTSEAKEFIKTLDSLTGRWNRYQVWQDFIWMTACAISNSVDPWNREEREQMYTRQARKYDDQEMAKFSGMLALLIQTMEGRVQSGTWCDFLGDLFMWLELGNDAGGQFFTPYHLCKLMASTVIDVKRAKQIIDEDDYVTINEPACGAGATLIAAAETLKENGIDYQHDCLFTAQDIDLTTALMCYIQLSLLGCAGYVRVGNTLTDPQRGDILLGDGTSSTWYTPMYFAACWTTRRIIAQQRAYMAAAKPNEPGKLTTQGDGQIAFDLGGCHG